MMERPSIANLWEAIKRELGFESNDWSDIPDDIEKPLRALEAWTYHLENENANLKAEKEKSDRVLRSLYQGAVGNNNWYIEKIQKLEAENAELRDALSMTLPMAKGYAYDNQVGANMSKVLHADDALTKSREREGK